MNTQAIVLALFSCVFINSALYGEIILQVDFNNRQGGQYTRAMLNEDWDPQWGSGLDEGRVYIVDDANAHEGKSLRICYPKGGVGPGEGGAQWRVNLQEYEELYASYYIMFPQGWNGVKGGKLPGLCGKDCPTGGADVTGTNGFSARYMFKSNMKVIIYLYHTDQPGKWGENFELNYSFDQGRWYKLTQRIKMNRVNQFDGEVQVWVDDEEALFLNDIRFRTVADVKVDRYYFSTFYGGNSADWAPVKDEHIYFDDFVIYTDPSDVMSAHRIDHTDTRPLLIQRHGTHDIVLQLQDARINALSVHDIQGRSIMSFDQIGHHAFTLCTRRLGQGIYILNINSDEKRIRRKFMVIH